MKSAYKTLWDASQKADPAWVGKDSEPQKVVKPAEPPPTISSVKSKVKF
jgi:hypothetical protein